MARTGDGDREADESAAVGLGPAAVLSDAIHAFGLPAKVGRYSVTAELGRGRYGTVYAAEDPDDGRPLAIKRISGAVADDPVLRRRCLREADVAAKLDHPGLVKTLRVEEADFGLLLILERCPGLDLQRVLALRPGRPLPLDWSVEVVRQAAEAVGAGHTAGVVHRDLKPANVMIDPPPAKVGEESLEIGTTDGGRPAVTARVLDFGLALPLEEEFRLTRTSMMVGTPLYMSPEQAAGNRDEIGPPTDVFGLGAILYELLVGEPPFMAATVTAILERLGDGDVVPPRRRDPAIPEPLECICMRCLRDDVSERYADASELAADLARFQAGGSTVARRDRWHERVRRWARKPRRAKRAGGLIAAVLGATVVWSFLVVPIYAAIGQIDRLLNVDDGLSLVITFFVLTPPVILSAWSAYRTAMTDRANRFTLLGVGTTAFYVVLTAGTAVGLIDSPLAIYTGRVLARVNTFMFLATLFAIAHWGFVVIWAGRRIR